MTVQPAVALALLALALAYASPTLAAPCYSGDYLVLPDVSVPAAQAAAQCPPGFSLAFALRQNFKDVGAALKKCYGVGRNHRVCLRFISPSRVHL